MNSHPHSSQPESDQPAGLPAIIASGLEYTLTQHGPVSSLAEAAAARGVDPSRIIKSLVVRRSPDDYLFVLVPGGRSISWPKLRALLGVNRLSMPAATEAMEVTGYPRGSITPFGATTAWPVIADVALSGVQVSIGAGAPGAAVVVDADQLVEALGATLADVTDPELT